MLDFANSKTAKILSIIPFIFFAIVYFDYVNITKARFFELEIYVSILFMIISMLCLLSPVAILLQESKKIYLNILAGAISFQTSYMGVACIGAFGGWIFMGKYGEVWYKKTRLIYFYFGIEVFLFFILIYSLYLMWGIFRNSFEELRKELSADKINQKEIVNYVDESNYTKPNYNPTERETHLLMIAGLVDILTRKGANINPSKYLKGNKINKSTVSEDIATEIETILKEPTTRTKSAVTIRYRLNEILKLNDNQE